MSEQAEPISPCVGVCVINQDTGMCYGCYRHISEVGRWMMMSKDERRQVLRDVAERRNADPSRKRNS
ncbi:MAG: DUF1289 domain-containing protein [Alphaproteobacteria bacterium]